MRYAIIDSHCHIYPEHIAPKAVAGIDHFYDHLPTDHYDGTIPTLTASGRRCGIGHFVVHSVATRPEQVSSINRFLAESALRSGGRFTGLGTLHPDSERLEADLDELMALGLKGVKLHPDFQRFPADDPRAMRIYALCERHNLPVCIHAGDHRFDYSNPNRVAPILEAFPDLRLIAAHFGGWSVWEDALKILPGYPNLIVDSSSTFYTVQPDFARRMIDAYGIGRILFGTDYPMWPQQADIDYWLSLNLSEGEYRRVFAQNASELFDITLEEQEATDYA